MTSIKIAPSIVSADLGHLADQVQQCEEAGAEYIHIDIMDGRFVPAITIGWPVVEAIRRSTNLVLDIHLMVVEPEKQIGRFMDAGGDIINVHIEAAKHVHRIIQEVQSNDRKAGICLNPGTALAAIDAVLPEIDQVMVMAVNPGASGQLFIEAAVQRVADLRKAIDDNGYHAEIEVDGGITTATGPSCATAGANVLVAASAIFNDRATIAENITALQDAVAALRA